MATNLTPTPLRTSYADASAEHLVKALAMTEIACQPACRDCGGAAARVENGGRCSACWMASVRRGAHARIARASAKDERCRTEGWSLVCEKCCELAPKLNEGLCGECHPDGVYESDEGAAS